MARKMSVPPLAACSWTPNPDDGADAVAARGAVQARWRGKLRSKRCSRRNGSTPGAGRDLLGDELDHDVVGLGVGGHVEPCLGAHVGLGPGDVVDGRRRAKARAGSSSETPTVPS